MDFFIMHSQSNDKASSPSPATLQQSSPDPPDTPPPSPPSEEYPYYAEPTFPPIPQITIPQSNVMPIDTVRNPAHTESPTTNMINTDTTQETLDNNENTENTIELSDNDEQEIDNSDNNESSTQDSTQDNTALIALHKDHASADDDSDYHTECECDSSESDEDISETVSEHLDLICIEDSEEDTIVADNDSEHEQDKIQSNAETSSSEDKKETEKQDKKDVKDTEAAAVKIGNMKAQSNEEKTTESALDESEIENLLNFGKQYTGIGDTVSKHMKYVQTLFSTFCKQTKLPDTWPVDSDTCISFFKWLAIYRKLGWGTISTVAYNSFIKIQQEHHGDTSPSFRTRLLKLLKDLKSDDNVRQPSGGARPMIPETLRTILHRSNLNTPMAELTACFLCLCLVTGSRGVSIRNVRYMDFEAYDREGNGHIKIIMNLKVTKGDKNYNQYRCFGGFIDSKDPIDPVARLNQVIKRQTGLTITRLLDTRKNKRITKTTKIDDATSWGDLIFKRSQEEFNRTLKQFLQNAGLKDATRWSIHSCRAGFMTSLFEGQKSINIGKSVELGEVLTDWAPNRNNIYRYIKKEVNATMDMSAILGVGVKSVSSAALSSLICESQEKSESFHHFTFNGKEKKEKCIRNYLRDKFLRGKTIQERRKITKSTSPWRKPWDESRWERAMRGFFNKHFNNKHVKHLLFLKHFINNEKANLRKPQGIPDSAKISIASQSVSLIVQEKPSKTKALVDELFKFYGN